MPTIYNSHFYKIYIITSERGIGLAKTLMEYHEKKAKEIGCRQLFLK
ncbi:GNAT family N-acetyltransferase [Vallitalea sp.]